MEGRHSRRFHVRSVYVPKQARATLDGGDACRDITLFEEAAASGKVRVGDASNPFV